MIKQLFLAFLLFGFLSSCGNKNKNEVDSHQPIAESKKIIDTLTKEIFTVDTFSVFPPVIEGCSCYFSNNKIEFESKKYIYADDYVENAFVLINGIMTKFKFTEGKQLEEKHTISKRISMDKKYELIIDIKQISESDETWQYQGTLTIKRMDGQKIIKTIYGECGC